MKNKLIYDMMSKKVFQQVYQPFVQESHCGDQHIQVHYEAVEWIVECCCLRNILPLNIINF